MVQVSARLVEFRGLVRDVVRSACRTALLDAGFTPDDYFYEPMDTLAGGTVATITITLSILYWSNIAHLKSYKLPPPLLKKLYTF